MADVFKTYDEIKDKHGDIDIKDIYNKGSFAIRSAYFKDRLIRERDTKYEEIARTIISSGRIAECLYYIAHAKNGGYEIASKIYSEICYQKGKTSKDLKTYLEENELTNNIMNDKSKDEKATNLSEIEELLEMYKVGKSL